MGQKSAFSIILAAVLILSWPEAAAYAQDAYNPFAEVEKKKAVKPKAQPPAPADEQPALAPMDGVSKPQAPGTPAKPTNAQDQDTVMREGMPPPVEKAEVQPVEEEEDTESLYMKDRTKLDKILNENI